MLPQQLTVVHNTLGERASFPLLLACGVGGLCDGLHENIGNALGRILRSRAATAANGRRGNFLLQTQVLCSFLKLFHRQITNMVEIIRIAAIKLNSHFTFEHRRIQFNFEMSLTLWSKQLVLSCPDRGQHWFTKVLSGKPAGSLTKTEQANYKSTPIVDLKKK